MGLIIYRATAGSGLRGWERMGSYILIANAPDLDFVPGFLVGDLSRFHHGPSHSIGFALFFGMLSSILVSRRLYAFVIGFSLYLSHVVLDYLIQDPSPPHGVPLLWPFSDEYYMAPFAFLPKFDYRPGPTQSVFSAVFSLGNLRTMVTEVLLLVPWLVAISFWIRGHNGDRKPSIPSKAEITGRD